MKYIRSFATLLILFIYNIANAQILPKEGSVLNYRLIGFSLPAFTNIQEKDFTIEIAAGRYYSEDSFKKHIVKKLKGNRSRIIGTVPAFACDYTWRGVKTGSNSKKTFGELHHFRTGFFKNVDTAQARLRVIDPAKKFRNAYVFLDGNSTLYDIDGKPVWYLPESYTGIQGFIRDLKMSPQGTITFLAGMTPMEINYDGELLWKAPEKATVGGGATEFHHHEFTRLSNGNYMVLGNEDVAIPLYDPNNVIDTSVATKPLTQHRLLGTVIEYDGNGKVVWSWKLSQYFAQSDLPNYFRDAYPDPHENAFFFDEKDKIVYLSFKDISRILKIKYPEGKVLNSYGEVYKPGQKPQGNGLFCGQHACKYSQLGCLFLFNNNGCNKGGLPKVKKFRELNDDQNTLKKIWEYQCTVEAGVEGDFFTGGNVAELPDNSLFVCMGGNYSKVFVVTTDKKVLWSALPEQWDTEKNKWTPLKQYRASVIPDRKALESLIWHDEAANKRIGYKK